MSLDYPYSFWVVACSDNSRAGLWIRNETEAASLRVYVTFGSAYLNLGTATPKSFGELVVAQAVTPVNLPDGTVVLPPGVTVTARNASAAEDYVVDMNVDASTTTIATISATTAELVSDKLKSPSQRLADSVSECGKSAATLVQENPGITPEGALQSAYAGFQCRSAFRALDEAAFGEAVAEADATGSQRPPVGPLALAAENPPALAATTLRAAESAPRLSPSTVNEIFENIGKAGFRLVARR